LNELRGVDPLKTPSEFSNIIWRYLKPSGERPAPRAHLFTINGLTYPIHRDFGFIAVPDPIEIVGDKYDSKSFTQRSKRRYSMLAYLYSVRPGDLIFFFQADPQHPKDIWNRRGFRGVWIASSAPFRDTTTIQHPKTGYEELGACPHCNTPFNFGEGELRASKKCLKCGKEYGTAKVKGNGEEEFSKVVLSARLLIKPLVVFKKTAGDNRVYSDLTISPLIWISRADNAMGAGKGSTIRTLLPEEATKIAYMLVTEDGQEIEYPQVQSYPGRTNMDIADYNNMPSMWLRAVKQGRDWRLEHELELNLYFALNIDKPQSNIQKLLNIPLNRVEWWTTEFPWGYTGDTSDFVLTLWDDKKGRYAIYLFEFKRDAIDLSALAEIILYVPWVVQVLANTNVTYDSTIEVQPVLVGRGCNLKAIPEDYTLNLRYSAVPNLNTTICTRKIVVRTPLVLTYSIREGDCIQKVSDKYRKISVCYVKDLNLTRLQLRTRSFVPPPPTFTTTGVEREAVVKKYLKQKF